MVNRLRWCSLRIKDISDRMNCLPEGDASHDAPKADNPRERIHINAAVS